LSLPQGLGHGRVGRQQLSREHERAPILGPMVWPFMFAAGQLGLLALHRARAKQALVSLTVKIQGVVELP
jgi:hypothetical protein